MFSFRRKWLPPPLRKLSQGKVDKSTSSERPLVKKGSDKTFKLPTEKQSEEEYNNSNQSKSLINSQSAHQDVEADEEGTCDLPPPMKPIQDSQTMVANGPTNLTVVEQSPCKRVCFWNMKIFYFFNHLIIWGHGIAFCVVGEGECFYFLSIKKKLFLFENVTKIQLSLFDICY